MKRLLSLLMALCAAAASAADLEPPRVVVVDRTKLPIAERIATHVIHRTPPIAAIAASAQRQ